MIVEGRPPGAGLGDGRVVSVRGGDDRTGGLFAVDQLLNGAVERHLQGVGDRPSSCLHIADADQRARGLPADEVRMSGADLAGAALGRRLAEFVVAHGFVLLARVRLPPVVP